MITTNGPGEDDNEAEPLADINTTPLIDVMLVLLIMLIITIPLQTHAVKLDMPAGPSDPPPVPPAVVTISVEADGTVRWDHDKVSDPVELEARLASAAAMPTQPEVHLRPDGQTAYGHVAAVLAAVQRQGVAKLGIVGGERFLD